MHPCIRPSVKSYAYRALYWGFGFRVLGLGLLFLKKNLFITIRAATFNANIQLLYFANFCAFHALMTNLSPHTDWSFQKLQKPGFIVSQVLIEAHTRGKEDTAWTFGGLARFVMVARNKNTGKATQVATLVPETPQQHNLFALGHYNRYIFSFLHKLPLGCFSR